MDGTGKMAWRGLWRESGVPLSWGGVGLRPLAFPTPLPRGPLRNNGKKLKRAPARPSCFFAPFPRLQKQAFDARYGYKKSPQAMLESFFSVVVR
jgi:hypothetical protein